MKNTKFKGPINVHTYKGLSDYYHKMRRLTTNKERLFRRIIKKQTRMIKNITVKLMKLFYAVELKQQFIRSVMNEIKTRGFDVAMIEKEANDKVTQWVVGPEYKKMQEKFVKYLKEILNENNKIVK